MFIYILSSHYCRRAGMTNRSFTEKDVGTLFEAEISLNNGLIEKKKLRIEGVDRSNGRVYVSIEPKS